MSWAVVLLLDLTVSGPRAARSSTLTAVAQASARPEECSSALPASAASGGASFWEMARDPALDRYCDVLAAGFAQLPFSPDRAIENADRAESSSPGRAGPHVLRGRAQAIKRAWAEAREHFEKARAIDPRSLEDPLTMREWARALSHVGRGSEALEVYRTLGPRLSALSSADDRARTFLEAAELAFSLGPGALDDAISFLREARRLAGRDVEWRVGAELALALDRKGEKDEAAALAVELASQRRRSAPVATLASESADEVAARALVLETVDPKQAAEAWGRYLARASEGPFAEHARTHAASVHRRPVKVRTDRAK